MSKLNLSLEVERDIAKCTDVLENHSFDREKLSALFNELLQKYVKIEGFSKDLQVVNDYDKKRASEIYNSNIALIKKRLEYFLANKCKSFSKAISLPPENINELFEAARVKISISDDISQPSKNDIFEKLEKIREICISETSAEEKWESMRPLVMWLSGKDAKSALIILPLILKINQE